MVVQLLVLELWAVFSDPLGIIILFVFMNSMAGSIWINGAWTPFVFQVFGDGNIYVGLMAALNGIFELIFGFIAAHLSDKVIGPSVTLIIAVCFGVFTLIFTVFSIWMNVLGVIVVSQSMYGAFLGLSLTSVESVFAQCAKQGKRDHIYGVKFSLEASGPIVGLLISLVFFYFFGNSWSVEVLRWTLSTGIMLHFVSMLTFLLRFKPIPCHLDSLPESCDARKKVDNQEKTRMLEEVHSLCVEEKLPRLKCEKKEEEKEEVCVTTTLPAPPVCFHRREAFFFSWFYF